MIKYLVILFDGEKHEIEAKEINKITFGELYDEKGRALHDYGIYKGKEIPFVSYETIAPIPMSLKKYKFKFLTGTEITGDILLIFSNLVWLFAYFDYIADEMIILPIKEIKEID
ncbi:hypothetical protein [Marinitoga sp. 1155]|uniref:hypothetical protein n=1 Tax=Marinitoga sp. 1155 TaxID=1428448 RepID=UPI000640DE82|nr:hypothetical protein [Marinitoga sp. 1155]AJW76977.1 hypothetical protein UF09_11 [Marinitoga camini virus 2]KLO24803.1 hypothetical protein X274_02310 [Marinitoga sp. 1155]